MTSDDRDTMEDLLGPAPLPRAPAPRIPARQVARQFLELLAKGYSPTKAAKCFGLSRSAFYNLRERWPEFAEAWQLSLDASVDVLEDAAMQRAVEGIDRPVYFQGELVGSYKEYSDSLLVALLKARAPERYRERHGINAHIDGTLNIGNAILEARKRAGITIDATPTSAADTPEHGNER